MLFVTAKISKKKVILTILVFLAAAAIIIFLPRNHPSMPEYTGLDSNESRVSLLNSFGWQVVQEPEEAQAITIPENFPEAYERYNELQNQSGFNLKKYAGKSAERYSYLVVNYPDYDGPVYADMLIINGKLIGGDVHSLELDGFMIPLK